MKKLVIDIKNNYAVFAAGGDFKPEFGKIDFDEADFEDDTGTGKLLKIGGQKLRELYADAQQVVLTVPMRFSMVKAVEIDTEAIERLGDDFLRWEATQQIPEELGKFASGFSKLGESFDNRKIKYMFYVTPRDFIQVLIKFVAGPLGPRPVLNSEAIGLFNALNLVSDCRGFNAAVSLEHDGATVVLSCDGDFVSGKFITGEGSQLSNEIMYYVLGHTPEGVKPQLLLSGDLAQVNHLNEFSWAELLRVQDSFGIDLEPEFDNPELFVTAAGLNLPIKNR